MIRDFFEIIKACRAALYGSELFGAIVVAIILGGVCWLACSYYTKLWNKRFHVKIQHHLLCAFASIMTIIFTIHFRAANNLEFIADDIVVDWYDELMEDNDFHINTYEIAFYALKEMNPGAFNGVPDPDQENSYIPFANNDMMQKCVEIYVKEACDDFSTQHPFLNLMLRARPGISKEEIQCDIQEYFRENPGKRYPLERAVIIAAEHIRESLFLQSPKTVWKTKTILVLLFLAVQLIPFGTIGYYAYKDLKIGENTYSNQSFSSYNF